MITKLLMKIFLILTLFFQNEALSIDFNQLPVAQDNGGYQFLDVNSLKILNNEEIEVLSTYILPDKTTSYQYLMLIDCVKNQYKDKSINGIEQKSNKWLDPHGDFLIDSLIKKSCKIAQSNKS